MAAINFPDSPSNGDTHTVGGVTYTYNSAETKWKTTINSNAFLPLSGGTVTGNVTLQADLDLQDDDKILLGTGDDLEIYHDGSHSYISDSGTGNLYIKASNNLLLRSATNEDYLDCTANGAVRLYHDNSIKLATTSSGVSVTGDLQFNSGYGSVATAYGVRAWVCFNGNNGTVLEDGNVSSVTDNATGNYTINFATSFPDTNYACTGSSDSGTGGHGVIFDPPATGTITMKVFETNGTLRDHDKVFAIFVR